MVNASKEIAKNARIAKQSKLKGCTAGGADVQFGFFGSFRRWPQFLLTWSGYWPRAKGQWLVLHLTRGVQPIHNQVSGRHSTVNGEREGT